MVLNSEFVISRVFGVKVVSCGSWFSRVVLIGLCCISVRNFFLVMLVVWGNVWCRFNFVVILVRSGLVVVLVVDVLVFLVWGRLVFVFCKVC